MTTQVVLLCGGRGERLRPLTDNCQKCLLSVGNKPFMDKVIERFAFFGYKEFLLLAGYLGSDVRHLYAEWGDYRGLKIRVRQEGTNSPSWYYRPKGTLTDLRDAYTTGWIQSEFILANGDTFPLFDLRIPAPPPTGITVVRCDGVDSGVRRFGMVPLAHYPGSSVERDLIPALGDKVRYVDEDRGFLDIGTPENYERAKVIFR